ncbi:hypothetical protein ABS771_08475 [Methylobacterium brachiatum]|uniref:Uncharacterized protein n=1 Tax=Methylobacterium brachiatum TaxID=269660 RepID=A0ABV1QVS5_9HYPH
MQSIDFDAADRFMTAPVSAISIPPSDKKGIFIFLNGVQAKK